MADQSSDTRGLIVVMGERFHPVVGCFYLALGLMIGAGLADESPEVRTAVRLAGAVLSMAALVYWLVRWQRRGGRQG